MTDDEMIRAARREALYRGDGEESDLPEQMADRLEALIAENARMLMFQCPDCLGHKWVCENHPKAIAHECPCGGAGMPCLSCNPSCRDGEIASLREALAPFANEEFTAGDMWRACSILRGDPK